IVLLEVPILLHLVAGGRKVVLIQNVLGDVGLGVAAWHGCQIIRTAGCLIEWSRTKAGNNTGLNCATVGVERAGRSHSVIVAGEEVRRGAADGIYVGVGSERHIVRNEEYSVSAPNDGFGVECVCESYPRQEFLLRERQVVAAVINARLNQEEIAGARTSRDATASGHGGIGD